MDRPSLPSALGRAGGPDAVAFVSTSQRDGSKHADLTALKAVHDYLRDRGDTPAEVRDGIGYWPDGKDESAAVHLDDPSKLQQVLTDLRNRFNQKATIGFSEDAGGPDQMHVIRVRETNPDKIHSDMSRHGIEYKTVVPGKTGSTVYSLDSGGVLKGAVDGYAKEQRAHVDSVPGHVSFVGGDERPNVDPVKLALVSPAPFSAAADADWNDDTTHDVLADYLAENGDPREDIVRNRMSRLEAQSGAQVQTALQRPPTFTHKFPDGTLLDATVHGPQHVHVTWDAHPKAARPYHTVMTRPEFKDWLGRFPDAERDKIKRSALKSKRPVKLALDESVNKATRVGNQFVKTPAESGSPHAEAQAARVFKTIGLPHLHVEEQNGNVVGPWVHGLTGVSEQEPHFSGLKAAYNPERVGHLQFGEWLTNAGDRVGRNYQTHPTLGLIGNDYGHAFHPMTDEWSYHKEMQRRGQKPALESYKSMTASPNKYAEYHPDATALPGLLRYTGLADRAQHKALRVPDHAVKAALDNEPHLLDAAFRATQDLPEAERVHAVKAMKARLDAVRSHFTNRGSLTIGDLATLTSKVRQDEEARRAARPK